MARRATYFEGRKVEDLAAHPVLGETVDVVAEGYDRFYSSRPGATNSYLSVPRSGAELKARMALHHEADYAIAGGSIVTAPSLADLENTDIGELIRKYMGTKQSVDGRHRLRLFHAIRDLTADSYGGWLSVTSIQAGGGLYAQRIVTRKHYDLDAAKRLALATAGLGSDHDNSAK